MATSSRFVQIPIDGSAPPGAFEVGYAARPWPSLSPEPLDDARKAECAGVLGALLHRYSQQPRIALDVRLGGQVDRDQKLALDLLTEEDAPVAALIEQAQALLRARAEGPGAAEAPSNVAVSFVDAPGESSAAFDGRGRLAGAPASYDLHFVVARTREGARLGVEYNARRFDPATVERVLESFVTLFEASARDRATPVGRLPLLSAKDLDVLTGEPEVVLTREQTEAPVRLFEALAATQPTAIAAAFHDEQLTYAELEARANQLANHLVACGVGPEIPVAVCLRPSLEIVVAILAIFKARGLYLPLDPTHPEALLARMLDEARPRLVLTTAELSPLIPSERFTVLRLDADAQLLAALPRAPPALLPNLDDPAYLFYTSGTTGKPKGVVATQGNLAHYLQVARRKYAFRPSDVFISLARYTFSISLFELLSPLCCGGQLRLLDRDAVLSPERLSQALQEVTVLHAGPSLLGSLFRYLRSTPTAPSSFPRMRHASSGGDMVLPSIMEDLKRVFENAEVYVIYGSTEISCMGTTFPVSRDVKVTRTFVGKPFPGVQLRVLDPARQLVPFGVVGEICFAGRGISRGYLDRPDLTAERFVQLDHLRLYQTGDLGRLHPDGNLEILGRRDFQVQLRGIRIELAGIEKMVLELGLAVQCAVACKTMGEDDSRLVAFVVKPAVPDIASFRRALAAQLPDYMLPHHVVVLEAMPLTVNGKLDRHRLNELPLAPQLGSAKRGATEDELERRLAEVFCRVLGVNEVGAEESFFDLGGDSLRAVVAIQEIEATLGLTLPPHVVFEQGTVRALAKHIRDARSVTLRPILLNERANRPPLFMLSGIHLYRRLAKRMGEAYSAYGVFVDREVRMFDPTSDHHSVHDLGRDYLEIIRRAQPQGPYRLLGYSFAGIVAYEVAQQLRRAGEEVQFLGLLDAHLPEWTQSWRFRLAQLERMRTVSPSALLAFATRRLRERLGDVSGPQFARHQEDATLAPLEEQRDIVNREAAGAYLAKIQSYDGAVTVITSAERLRRDPLHSPSCGWAPYIPGLRLHQVNADHFRMMSDEPYVSQMAEALVADLQATEVSNQSTPKR